MPHQTQRLPAALNNAQLDAPHLIGRVLADRYVLTRKLGQGATAQVYAARDLHSNHERHAIKLVRLDQPGCSPAEVQHRLRHEVQAMVRVRSAHIVRFEELIELSPREAAIVMELGRGVDLESLLEDGPLPLVRAAEIARQLAAGLSDLHRARIVHRDIKPSNVLLAQDNQGRDFVQLIDLGISLADDQVRATQGFLGTPAFASPEQVLGGEVDHRSDLYSLGLVFYAMLAGEPPFMDDAIVRVMTSQVTALLPDIRDERPQLPAEVQTILSRLSAKSPDARYPDALAVIWALEALLDAVDPGQHGHDRAPRPEWFRPLCTACVHLHTCALADAPTACDAPRTPAHLLNARQHERLIVARADGLWQTGQDGAPFERLWPLDAMPRAFDQRGDWLSIADEGGVVTLIDLNHSPPHPHVIWRAPEAPPHQLALSPHAGALLIAHGESLTTCRRDGDAHWQIMTVALPAQAVSLAVETSALPYAVGLSSAEVAIYQWTDHHMMPLRRFHTGEPPEALSLSHDGYVLAAWLRGQRQVVLFEAVTGRPISALPLDVEPLTIGFDRKGHLNVVWQEGAQQVRWRRLA